MQFSKVFARAWHPFCMLLSIAMSGHFRSILTLVWHNNLVLNLFAVLQVSSSVHKCSLWSIQSTKYIMLVFTVVLTFQFTHTHVHTTHACTHVRAHTVTHARIHNHSVYMCIVLLYSSIECILIIKSLRWLVQLIPSLLYQLKLRYCVLYSSAVWSV